MFERARCVIALCCWPFTWACGGPAPAAVPAEPASAPPRANAPARQAASIEELNTALGRGINLGNALEAPKEGEWGVTLRDEDFTLIANAGFEHIRVPIRWSAHAMQSAPYTIDPTFFERVDWVVDSGLAAGLRVIINMHHYDGIAKQPEAHRGRFIGLWKQLAEHYRGYPEELYFELLNEPHDALTADKNNALLADTLRVVRQSNERRAVIVGSVQWSSFRGLPELELPADDQHLIVTFHYYDPFDFTHQGAPWVNKEEQVGIDWPGAVGTAANIQQDFETAVAWAREHDRPLYLGEFGAYNAAEMGARERWTAAVVQEANRHQLPFAYWELRAGFGAYDPDAGAWRQPLLDALLQPSPTRSAPNRSGHDTTAAGAETQAAE